MKRRVNVRGIAVDSGGNILAVKHRDRDTSGESDFWAIPGGGLDTGEALDTGLIREFEEELGITPKLGRLLFMQQFIYTHRDSSQSEKMEFFFHVTNPADFLIDIDLSQTSHGQEIARIEFINPAASDLLPSFLQRIDVRRHIETNQPVLLVNNLQEDPR